MQETAVKRVKTAAPVRVKTVHHDPSMVSQIGKSIRKSRNQKPDEAAKALRRQKIFEAMCREENEAANNNVASGE